MANRLAKSTTLATFQRLPKRRKGTPHSKIIAIAMQPIHNPSGDGFDFEQYNLHATKGWRRA